MNLPVFSPGIVRSIAHPQAKEDGTRKPAIRMSL
jgi:hypothetical protein